MNNYPLFLQTSGFARAGSDHDVKLKRYALAGIPEVWIENLERDQLLVFRDPMAGKYQTCLTLHPGNSVTVSAFPDAGFKT